MRMSSRRGASAAAGTQSPVRTWRTWRRIVSVLPVSAVLVLAACSGGAGSPALARQVSGQQPPPCSANPPQEAPPLHPTTVTTIGQAYYCIFAHYYAGPVVDDRVLLAAAFAGFTQELDQLRMDQPDATMPALTGHRDSDWDAFAAVYQKVTGQLPASPAQRQELAAATMTAMVASLGAAAAVHHRGAAGIPRRQPRAATRGHHRLRQRRPAVHRRHHLRRGDEPAVRPLPAARPGLGAAAAARHRPHLDSDPDTRALPAAPSACGIREAAERRHRLRAAARVLPRRGRPGAAGDTGARLRGVILDLRGNGGGSPAEVSTLLGAFTHGTAYAYDCDVHGNCPATRTGTGVPLLHLPLVVLTDRILPARHELSAGRELINGIGVAPDYYVPLTAHDLSTGHDPDITKALTLLGG